MVVGERHADLAFEFIQDLAHRLTTRVQLTSDGHKPYLKAVEETFRGNIDYAIAIYFMHYNCVRIHTSLRVTPAMAAGVTQELWSMGDVVNMIEDWEAKNSQAGKSN